MHKPGTVIFLADGMADEPLAQLDGKTPLEYAKTPAMDSIAAEGLCGSLLTLPEGFPTSSEVANMSVLGCDLQNEYCGRGPIEAAGRNIVLGPQDKAFRLNLTTVRKGILTDFSGGHPSGETAAELIASLEKAFGSDCVKFYSGVSYRNLLVLSGAEYSHKIQADKPDDCQGDAVSNHFPKAIVPEAETTAGLLVSMIKKAPEILEASPANQRLMTEGRVPVNGIWPWSGGGAGSLQSLKDKFGISSAVISAVDVIVGLGRCLGMDVISVPGATGYIDTNYEGKADAAVEAVKTKNLVYVHVEAIDEVSHEQNIEKKIMAIEDFDSRVVARVLEKTGRNPVNAVVLPDHPVPVATGKHTRTPVPVAVRLAERKPDEIKKFSEKECPNGALGLMTDGDLMRLLFPA